MAREKDPEILSEKMINGELTHLSLFSGIGELDLAAEWAGFKTVGQCECADYPTKVLEKHWPYVERWKDIRTLTGENFYDRTGLRTVDVISGGFPCQPFSVAGKQRGKEDDRYLWPEMVRVIKELRPTWIVGENVAGIVKMALSDILFELEAEGYRTRAFLIPACAVGARHRRYRVAIVANTESTRDRIISVEREEQGQENTDFDWCGENVQYTYCTGCKELHVSDAENWRKPWEIESRRETWRSGSGDWRATESVLGGMADGIPGRMDRDLDFLINHYWDKEPDIPRIANGVKNRVEKIKCLGNAVAPQQFYPIFKSIYDIEYMMNWKDPVCIKKSR